MRLNVIFTLALGGVAFGALTDPYGYPPGSTLTERTTTIIVTDPGGYPNPTTSKSTTIVTDPGGYPNPTTSKSTIITDPGGYPNPTISKTTTAPSGSQTLYGTSMTAEFRSVADIYP